MGLQQEGQKKEDKNVLRPIDPEIVKKFPPPGSKPFSQHTIVEIVIGDLKRLLEKGI